MKAGAADHSWLGSWIIVGSLFLKGRQRAHGEVAIKNIIDFAVRGSTVRKKREKEIKKGGNFYGVRHD